MSLPVKIATACLSVFCAGLIDAATPPLAGPGEAAVAFLEVVRERGANLEPGGDTAISSFTAESKRREITRRWQRVARDVGRAPVEVGAVRQDEDLAGVLLHLTGGYDPASLQVIALAMVRRDSGWLPAPVPASFDNAGLGFQPAVRKRVRALEQWLLESQVEQLQTLREESAERMRREISARLPEESLRGLSHAQVGRKFLEACAGGDLTAVLGWMGGLANPLPADWPARLEAAEGAIRAARNARRPWRLLVSPDVLRLPLAVPGSGEAPEDGLLSLACLDPVGTARAPKTPTLHVVHLEVSRDEEGLWRVDPPQHFLNAGSMEDEESDAEILEKDLLRRFPQQFRGKWPAKPEASVEELGMAVQAALRAPTPEGLARLLVLPDSSAQARRSAATALQLWWVLHEPEAVRAPVLLGCHAHGEQGAAVFQIFCARHPDRADLRTVHFSRAEGGWLWRPLAPAADQVSPELAEWIRTKNQQGSTRWRASLLAGSQELKTIHEPAPAAGEASALFQRWSEALRAGDLAAALALTAHLPGDQGERLLRNLSYEMVAAARGDTVVASQEPLQQGHITAVPARIDGRESASHALYPVVTTPEGPRLLLEVDLFALASRSRSFLNRTALARLSDNGHEAAAEDLRTLLRRHEERLDPAFLPPAARPPK